MFTNREGCTVWEKTSVNRAPAYVRHELGRCYWEEVRGQTAAGRSTGSDARAPDDSVFVSIPASSLNGYYPKRDDRIMEGSVPDDKPPRTALTVMSVRNCLHGSKAVQHIEVKAE